MTRFCRFMALVLALALAPTAHAQSPAQGSANGVWRDYVVDGVASSGVWNPQKSSIRNWGTQVEGSLSVLYATRTGGSYGIDTLADLFAFLTPGPYSLATVLNDPTPTNNGMWYKVGASGAGTWVQGTVLTLGAQPTWATGSVVDLGCSATPTASVGGTALAPTLDFGLPNCTGALGALTAGMTYKGVWNAATNSPSLASSVGVNGTFYLVSTTGTTNLNGVTNWSVGDSAVYNGTSWQRVPSPFSTPSVLTGASGNGTYAGAINPLTINRSSAAFDTGLVINMPASAGGVSATRYSALDIYLDSTAIGSGLRMFDTRTSPPQALMYWNAGGLNTSVNINLCTRRFGTPTLGENQTFGCWSTAYTPSSGATSGALNVLNDTVGPAAEFGVISQDAMPGLWNTDWRDGTGAFVAAIMADGSLGFGQYRGGVTLANIDTFIGRANFANGLQVGGRDNPSGTAQALVAPSAPAPITLRALPSAAGQNLLNYRYDVDGQVPLGLVPGMLITDIENPTTIPGGTTVSTVSVGAAYFTLSNNIASGGVGGVQLNDHMVFSWPNTAGADLSIAGGRGTGSAAGGKTTLSYAPAGSAGSNQNGWTPALVIGDTGAPSPVNVVTSLNAASYKSGGTAGVSCSGSPTGSFAVVNGIVTHC